MTPDIGGSSIDAPAVAERDFAQNPSFRAPLGMSVVLDLEAPGAGNSLRDTGPAGVDVIPYSLSIPESVHVCASDLGVDVADVELVAESDGRTVIHLTKEAPCADADLDAGDYDAKITRAAGGDGKSVPVFVHESLLGGTPSQCGADSDPDIRAGAPDDSWGMYTPDAIIAPGVNDDRPVIRSGGAFDPRSGWTLSRTASGPGDTLVSAKIDGVTISQTDSTQGRIGRGGGSYGWNFTPVADGAPWTYRIGFTTSYIGVKREFAWKQTGPRNLVDYVLLGSSYDYPWSWARVTLPIRYVPRGEQLQTLRRGEVALYRDCDFTGPAFVINDSNRFPLPANILGWFEPKSVRVGCGTSLVAFNDKSIKPIRFGEKTDRALTQCNPFDGKLRSMAVVHTRQITIETKSCTRCNLSRVDLRGLDLTSLKIMGGSLEGAHFENANLTGAAFDDVSLKDAVFDGATFFGTAFRGTFATTMDGSNAHFEGAHIDASTFINTTFGSGSFRNAVFSNSSLSNVGFGGATFDGASFDGTSLAAVDFSRTNLTTVRFDRNTSFKLPSGQSLVANPCDVPRPSGLGLSLFAGTAVRFDQLPPESWRYLNLSNVRFDTTSIPASQKTLAGKTLCGLLLGNIDLAGFDLTSARFDRSDLQGANLSNTNDRLATFNFTTLDRASFEYADLTNAQLDGATSDGTSATANVSFNHTLFRPATISQGRFTKVLMDDAIVRIPTGRHAGTTFDGGSFLRTDFTGSDLSGLSMLGAQFGDAIFVSTTLSGTKLGAGSSFSRAVFCKAHVKGASFDQANLSDALFPQVTGITTRNTNNTSLQTPCDPVLLDGAGSLETAVSSSSARCPSGRVALAAGCAGTDWTTTGPSPRDICPAVPDVPINSCGACITNCDCRSKLCSAGKCGPCTTP